MKWFYVGNYRWRFFYQKIFDSTKIVICCYIDDPIEIAEIDEIGKISVVEAAQLVSKKLEEIGSYA